MPAIFGFMWGQYQFQLSVQLFLHNLYLPLSCSICYLNEKWYMTHWTSKMWQTSPPRQSMWIPNLEQVRHRTLAVHHWHMSENLSIHPPICPLTSIHPPSYLNGGDTFLSVCPSVHLSIHNIHLGNLRCFGHLPYIHAHFANTLINTIICVNLLNDCSL